MADEFTTRRVEKLVAQYVATRSRRNDFISTGAAHRAVLQIMPQTGISDRALDDLIAYRALAHGLSVCFDRDSEAKPAASGSQALGSSWRGGSVPIGK